MHNHKNTHIIHTNSDALERNINLLAVQRQILHFFKSKGVYVTQIETSMQNGCISWEIYAYYSARILSVYRYYTPTISYESPYEEEDSYTDDVLDDDLEDDLNDELDDNEKISPNHDNSTDFDFNISLPEEYSEFKSLMSKYDLHVIRNRKQKRSPKFNVVFSPDVASTSVENISHEEYLEQSHEFIKNKRSDFLFESCDRFETYSHILQEFLVGSYSSFLSFLEENGHESLDSLNNSLTEDLLIEEDDNNVVEDTLISLVKEPLLDNLVVDKDENESPWDSLNTFHAVLHQKYKLYSSLYKLSSLNHYEKSKRKYKNSRNFFSFEFSDMLTELKRSISSNSSTSHLISIKVLNKLSIDYEEDRFLFEDLFTRSDTKLFSKKQFLFEDLMQICILFINYKLSMRVFGDLLGELFSSLNKKKHKAFTTFLEVLFTNLMDFCSSILGIKATISGRVLGKTRGSSLYVQVGNPKANSFEYDYHEYKGHIYNLSGAYGLHIGVTFKHKAPGYFDSFLEESERKEALKVNQFITKLKKFSSNRLLGVSYLPESDAFFDVKKAANIALKSYKLNSLYPYYSYEHFLQNYKDKSFSKLFNLATVNSSFKIPKYNSFSLEYSNYMEKSNDYFRGIKPKLADNLIKNQNNFFNMSIFPDSPAPQFEIEEFDDDDEDSDVLFQESLSPEKEEQIDGENSIAFAQQEIINLEEDHNKMTALEVKVKSKKRFRKAILNTVSRINEVTEKSGEEVTEVVDQEVPLEVPEEVLEEVDEDLTGDLDFEDINLSDDFSEFSDLEELDNKKKVDEDLGAFLSDKEIIYPEELERDLLISKYQPETFDEDEDDNEETDDAQNKFNDTEKSNKN